MIRPAVIGIFIATHFADALDAAGEPPAAGSPGPAVVAALVVGAFAALAVAQHAGLALAARSMDRGRAGRWAVRAEHWLTACRVATVGLHAIAALGLGWLSAVRAALGDPVLADELAACLPALAVLAAGWWSFYPVDRRVRDAVTLLRVEDDRPVWPAPTRGQYVSMQVRHQLLFVLVPLMLIVAWSEAVQAAAAWAGVDQAGLGQEEPATAAALVAQLAELAGAIGIFLLMPPIVRRLWDTSPLAEGDVRARLEAMCRRAGVRVRDLLVWRTRGAMANAAVLGFTPGLRYILLTDALLAEMPARHVEAVMAHEIGHVRRRHLAWTAAALVSSATLTAAVLRLALELSAPPWVGAFWADGASMIGGFAAAFLVVGLVVRRFEWQADAFAASQLGAADAGAIDPRAVDAMVGALSDAARLNHIPRHRPTWHHGSIADRQRRLRALAGRPVAGLPIDRQVAWIKAATAVAAGLVVAGMAAAALLEVLA